MLIVFERFGTIIKIIPYSCRNDFRKHIVTYQRVFALFNLTYNLCSKYTKKAPHSMRLPAFEPNIWLSLNKSKSMSLWIDQIKLKAARIIKQLHFRNNTRTRIFTELPKGCSTLTCLRTVIPTTPSLTQNTGEHTSGGRPGNVRYEN